jgi:hypothetical protein
MVIAMLRMAVELHMEEDLAGDLIMHHLATIQEHVQRSQLTHVVIILGAEPEQNITITPGVIITMEIRAIRTVVLMITEARHNIIDQIPGITVIQIVRGETADRAVIAAASTVVAPALTQHLLCPAVVEAVAVEEAAEIKFQLSTLCYGRKKIQDVPDRYCFA